LIVVLEQNSNHIDTVDSLAACHSKDYHQSVCVSFAVLEAGDLTSLLEQFEASEAFNTNSNSKPSVLDTHLYAMATQQLTPSTPRDFHVTANPTAAPTKGNTSILSHQNIKDSLPKEVIDRIKVSYGLLLVLHNIRSVCF
jgi:hypothetical protein